METRVCAGCKENLPLDRFAWKSKKNNQRQHRCRPCYKAYANAYYHRPVEKQKQITRVRKNTNKLQERYKQWRKTLYCSMCDETAPECMDLHHLDPSKKEYAVSKILWQIGSWNKFMQEVDKCIVVCGNCHRKIHSGRIKINGPVSPLASNQKKG